MPSCRRFQRQRAPTIARTAAPHEDGSSASEAPARPTVPARPRDSSGGSKPRGARDSAGCPCLRAKAFSASDAPTIARTAAPHEDGSSASAAPARPSASAGGPRGGSGRTMPRGGGDTADEDDVSARAKCRRRRRTQRPRRQRQIARRPGLAGTPRSSQSSGTSDWVEGQRRVAHPVEVALIGFRRGYRGGLGSKSRSSHPRR